MKLSAAEEIQVLMKVVLIAGRRVLDFHALEFSVFGELVQGARQADVFQEWLFWLVNSTSFNNIPKVSELGKIDFGDFKFDFDYAENRIIEALDALLDFVAVVQNNLEKAGNELLDVGEMASTFLSAASVFPVTLLEYFIIGGVDFLNGPPLIARDKDYCFLHFAHLDVGYEDHLLGSRNC